MPTSPLGVMGYSNGNGSMDNLGGFSVPAHLADEIRAMYQTGGVIRRSAEIKFSKGVEGTWIEGENPMRGEWIVSDENVSVNAELVTSWSWDYEEISPELQRGGITKVTLYLDTADGHDHIVNDLDELLKWSRHVEVDKHVSSQGQFARYVIYAVRYREQCIEEAKS